MDCASFLTGFFFSSVQGALDAGFSFLRDLAGERLGNLYNLGKNAEALFRDMRNLRDARIDQLSKIEMQERQQMKRRTQHVKRWFEDVDTLLNAVEEFRVDFEQRRTCLEGCSFGSLRANAGLGNRAAELLRQVREARDRIGNLGTELVAEMPPSPVKEIRGEPDIPFESGESILSDIRGLLADEAVGIIGILGMGGIGKTTLLKRLNNSLLRSGASEFSVVIFITVQKDPSTPKIQKGIGERIGLSLQADATVDKEEEQADKLFEALSKVKFLLLLDDMWKEIDLAKTGIPYPTEENKCKIIFTTRSKVVCTSMRAKHVRMNFLNDEESWKLFSENVGSEVNLNNSTIKSLAKKVAKKCGGLPLALKIVGRAMANAVNYKDWDDAIAIMEVSPQSLGDMEEKVLSLIKFSFERLKDEVTRQCLLYCSLFPEDAQIDLQNLVECWLGEGLLDLENSESIETSRGLGHNIITDLYTSCLLEQVDSRASEPKRVKMHDVVREMAVWLTGGKFDSGNRFLVYGGSGVTQFRGAKPWQNAKRISMMNTLVNELPSLSRPSPYLLTLLMSNCQLLKSIHPGFFLFTPVLRVLELSRAKIHVLPEEVESLLHLRYLNLSSTALESLPEGLGKLVNLRLLDLSWTQNLTIIPRDSIVTLSGLQSLNLYGSKYSFDDRTSNLVTHSDLEHCLKEVQELGFTIISFSSLKIILMSDSLSETTRFLKLTLNVFDLRTVFLLSAFERLTSLHKLFLSSMVLREGLTFNSSMFQKLNSLYLHDVHAAIGVKEGPSQSWDAQSTLSFIFPRLHTLSFYGCRGFKDLSWVGKLPSLEYIYLRYCSGIEELLTEDHLEGREITESQFDSCSFRALREMSLAELNDLKSISRRLLQLPSLKILCISSCPKLSKLPLGLGSAKNIQAIIGEEEWWDQLQWEDNNGDGNRLKIAFDPYFTTNFFYQHS